ncbi:MAG: hypothetical protein FWD34_07840 [Oscillospiraceae bacterium]|nr:hypothetical protein [Oscillospiraceae bacterium]
MNSEVMYNAIGYISDEKIAEADTDLLEQTSTIKKWHVFIPLTAACLIIAIAVSMLSLNKPEPYEPEPREYDLSNTSLIGLPVSFSNLSEPYPPYEASLVSGFETWSEVFKHNPPQAFVFVRVLNTELEQNDKNDRNTSHISEWQVSTLHIISTIWSDDIELPEIITIRQAVYDNDIYYISHNKKPVMNNLLRKDGVYMLPLRIFEEDQYGISSRTFEVDDEGKAWARMRYWDSWRNNAPPEFAFFNGKDANILAEFIVELMSDDFFFDTISTPFGKEITHYNSIIAQVTVLSETQNISLFIDNILYAPGEFHDLSVIRNLKIGETITRVEAPTPNTYEHGEQYLVFIYSFAPFRDVDIYQFAFAKINDDGTITPVKDEHRRANYFAEYDGYTIEEITDLIEQIQTWYDNYFGSEILFWE